METFKSVHEGGSFAEDEVTGKVTTGRNSDPEAQAISEEFKRPPY